MLENVHYIILPALLNDSAVKDLTSRFDEWTRLKVEMHVFDYIATTHTSESLIPAIQKFAARIEAVNVQMVSINMSEQLFLSVKAAGGEREFSRLTDLSGGLPPSKKRPVMSSIASRRLLFKYLARGAFKAVDVALNSTVSCDENYSVKADDVPFDKFDLISVITANNDFIKAEFRLVCSLSVMQKLCVAMHGDDTDVDTELLESMALELLNMVYGHAKSNLNDREGFRLPPAIPKLVRKDEFHRVQRSPAAQLTIMPVVTPMGSFYVEVDFT